MEATIGIYHRSSHFCVLEASEEAVARTGICLADQLRMSLRTRLFLVFATLVLLLVVAQAVLMRSLAADLSEQLDVVALDVGTSVAQVFASVGDVISARECHEDDADQDCTRRWFASGASQGTNQSADRLRSLDLALQRVAAETGAAQKDGHAFENVEVLTVKAIQPDASEHGPEADHITLRREIKLELAATSSGATPVHMLRLDMPDMAAHVPIPRSGLRQAIDAYERRLWLGSGLLLIIGLLASALVAHRVAAPLGRLAAAADDLGKGELGVQVNALGGSREVQRTVAAFNRMSERLEQLDNRNRRLEALRHLGEIGDIGRGLAHSLRNPLNALGLSVEEMAGRDPNAATAGLAASAKRQIRRLDRGIRSFLMLSSPSAGVVEEVALDDVVRDVALEVLHDGSERRLDLDLAPVRLRGVVAELRSVIQALVVNAVEASPPNQPVKVRLEAMAPPGDGASAVCARLLVEDRGEGLAPAIRERLFTPHLSTKATGSGMGLFLSDRIARHRYGGTLKLEDRAAEEDEAAGGETRGTRAVLELADRVAPGFGGPEADVDRGKGP